MNQDCLRALHCAQGYRALGLVPLPSRTDRKCPVLESYAQYRLEPVPEDVYTPESWTTSNIQLMTGVQTPGRLKIIAVDLDGDAARAVFREMCRRNGLGSSRIWISRSPSGGRHCYFSVPPSVEQVHTRMIWGICTTYGRNGTPEWLPHNEIKILGDGALVVAPPSIHVNHRASKARYEFEPGYSPKDFAAPMEAPQWLLEMPSFSLPSPVFRRSTRTPSPTEIRMPTSEFDQIQDSIPAAAKESIAESWGLRFSTSRAGCHGWRKCHSIYGVDHHPSASFHAETGRYKDFRNGACLSFFQLGVALGQFSSVKDCAEWCQRQVRI